MTSTPCSLCLGHVAEATVLRNAKGAGDDCRVLTLGVLILVAA